MRAGLYHQAPTPRPFYHHVWGVGYDILLYGEAWISKINNY